MDSLRDWRTWLLLVIVLVVNVLVVNVFLSPAQPKQVTISYGVFKAQVVADNVASITSVGDSITGETRRPVADSSDRSQTSTHFATQRPTFATDDLESVLEQHAVAYTAKPDTGTAPFWQTALLSFGPTLLLIFGFIWLTRRAAAGAAGGGVFGLGQSRA